MVHHKTRKSNLYGVDGYRGVFLMVYVDIGLPDVNEPWCMAKACCAREGCIELEMKTTNT